MKAVVLTNVNQQFFKNSSINARNLLLLQLKVLPKYWAHNVEQVSGWVGCSESRLWLNPLLQACTLVRTLSGIVIAKWGAGFALVLNMSNISSSFYFEKADQWYKACFRTADMVWLKLILGKAETAGGSMMPSYDDQRLLVSCDAQWWWLYFTKHVLASLKHLYSIFLT